MQFWCRILVLHCKDIHRTCSGLLNTQNAVGHSFLMTWQPHTNLFDIPTRDKKIGEIKNKTVIKDDKIT